MRVDHLKLTNFRQFAAAGCDLAPGLTVIHGRNGAGKTTLLEALFLLSSGRSHRTRDEGDLIRFGADHFRVEARFDDGYSLGYGVADDGRRSVEAAGERIALSDLVGRLLAVLFTPDDSQVIRGEPALRRRAFDLELSRLDRGYFDALRAYRVTLRQRNALLARHEASDLLPVYERRLAEYGAEMVRRMHGFVAGLATLVDEVYVRIPGSEGSLRLTQKTCVDDPAGTAEAVADELIRRLESARHYDMVRGTTSVGPHRDDYRFILDGRDGPELDLREFGSQGQVKSAALALKLAIMEGARRTTGRYPILLLDDLTSELDGERLAFFLEHVAERGQVVLTTTRPAALGERALATARVLLVRGGEVLVEKD